MAAYCSPGLMIKYRDGAGGYAETPLEWVAEESLLGGRPVRDFRWFRGRQFYSGWYWSATTGGLVAYESRLELARVLLADFDPAVTAIAAQPFQLTGADGDRVRRHVPDLLLRDASGLITVVDVKPAHRLDDAQVQAVFRWTARAVAARGWAFEVWSGADPVVLENVRFLAGYRRPATIDGALPPLVLDAARRWQTIGELELALRPHAVTATARPAILHLLWRGDLRADLSARLAGQTRVWLDDRAA